MSEQLETGCYVAGHWGIYAYQQVTELAESFGYHGRVLTEDECRDSSEDIDLVDIAEEAEDWLNENVAEEGHSFGWFDGEFYYWSNADWHETYGL